MKRSLVSSWSVILLLVFVASCGKEKSTEEDLSQYYIKCKIGSVDKTFNVSAAASKEDLGGGITNYSVFGNAVSDASNLEGLVFTIQISIPFATGTYKVNDPTTDYFLVGLYNPNTTDPDKIFVGKDNEADPFQVTFTEITSTTLSGTFKGKLLLNTDPSTDSAIISNGQFKVKIQ